MAPKEITDTDRINFMEWLIKEGVVIKIHEYDEGVEIFTCFSQHVDGETVRSTIDKAMKGDG